MGRTPWTGGDLILSRWDKPLRIVPWEEVADQWAQSDAVQKKIKRYGGIPFKKVSPQMRDLLVERGVKILPPTAKDGKACRQAYEEWMASSDQTRFSLTDEMREIETKAKEGKYLGKAPNGEKSDLETRKQWLEVRTKNFKDFFGDWEASALYKMAQEAISTKQHAGTYRFTPEEKLKKKLENLTGHPINGVIIESSRIIHVDKHHGEGEDQRGQIDITAEDIALLPYYLNNYDAIIPNPQYDTNEGRAYTVYKRINGVVVVGTIEIGKTGMAVATEFKKKVADVQMYNAPELNALDASAIAKVKKEILKLKENFENSSKVVDENGEPLVVYNANAVDADTIGEEVQVPINRFDRDIAHDGFWFTADKEFARRWVEEWMEYDNDRVRACYLNMRNPLVIDAKGADWKDVDGRSTDDWARYAEENGYDGLIVRNVLEGTDSEYTTKLTDSYAVFRPEQIKSATDNNGGFDATNPDIRFSLEDEVAEHKKGEKAFEPTENEKKVVKAMADHLNAIGIETTVDHKEGQRVLDMVNAEQKMHAIDVTPEMKQSVMEGQPMFFRTPNGEAYGFTLNGKIYIDPKIATSETPVHEYVHLWSEALEKANPEAWGHLKEQLLGKEDVLAYVKRRYPELTDENDLMHEVFSHYAGKRGAERLRREAKEEMEKAQGVFSKARVMNIFNTIRKALNRYWTMARNLFAGYNDKLKDMSAEDFADMAMADMLGGFDPRTEIRKREAYSEEKIREIVGDKVTDKNVSRVRGIIPLYNFLGNPKNHEVYAPYRSVHRTPTLNDYYIHTDAKFKAVPTGDRGVADAWQDMKASGKYEHHKSPLSDSEYLIDRESGDIYRMSDHWGRVASCQWDIDNPAEGMQIGKANIKDFKGNNRRGNGYEVDVSNFRTSYFNALDKTVKNLETLLGGGIEIDDAVRGRLERALDFYRTAKENNTVLERDRLFYSLAPDEADTGLWR